MSLVSQFVSRFRVSVPTKLSLFALVFSMTAAKAQEAPRHDPVFESGLVTYGGADAFDWGDSDHGGAANYPYAYLRNGVLLNSDDLLQHVELGYTARTDS